MQKKHWKITLAAGLLLSGCITSPEPAPLRLSVFMDHLSGIASQRGISVVSAAAAARSWGITGVDVIAGGVDETTLKQVVAAGLEPVCYVIFADFTHSDDIERSERQLDFAARNGFKRIMLVPGFLKSGEDREVLWGEMIRRVTWFVRQAGERGLAVDCEDFDSADVSIGSRAHIRRALGEVSALGHVLDTGNYAFWKDDVQAACREFRPRIRHVHIKDRDRTNPSKSVAAGTGTMPIREIVGELRSTGYDGWFVLECFGSKDMWNDIQSSARFMREGRN